MLVCAAFGENDYLAILLLISAFVVSLIFTFDNSIQHCASVITESKLSFLVSSTSPSCPSPAEL